MAEIYLADKDFDNALDAAYEAMSMFKEVEDQGKIAEVQCVVADIELAAGNTNKAFSTVNKALETFRSLKDSQGEWVALNVLEHITGPPPAPPEDEVEVLYEDWGGYDQEFSMEQWAQYQQYMMMMGGGEMPGMPDQVAPAADGGAPPMPQALAKKQGGGRTYDMSAKLDEAHLDADSVRKRLMDVVCAIADVDEDEDPELDQPLMQVGVTSKTAVGLRNALSEELPGVAFPFTLVFDYPSVNAITDLIMESVG